MFQAYILLLLYDSALHFEPVGDDVEWRIVFNVTQFDKETFPII